MNFLSSILAFLDGKKTVIGAAAGLAAQLLGIFHLFPSVAGVLSQVSLYVVGTGLSDKLLGAIFGSKIAGIVQAIAAFLGQTPSAPPSTPSVSK